VSLFLGDRKAVNQATAFVLDAFNQAARPNKFRRQQGEPEKNHQYSRPGSGQHNATCQQQGESSNNEEDPADLLDSAENHQTLRKTVFWRRGWDSNALQALETRNLLILSYPQKTKKTKND